MTRLLVLILILGATVPVRAAGKLPLRAHAAAAATGTSTAPIPEVGFQVKPCSYFFTLKNPRDFKIARPDSFGDLSQFKTIPLFYSVSRPVETTWKQYMSVNPLKIWSNHLAYVQAIYMPSKDRTLDRDALADQWTGFEEGMKVFVDMASLPVAVSNKPAMMVALQVTRIDPVHHTVEFKYLEGTPSYGRQLIQFEPAPSDPSATAITHTTWFRSYSSVIEHLYPIYHHKMINSMHAHFKWEIENGTPPPAH